MNRSSTTGAGVDRLAVTDIDLFVRSLSPDRDGGHIESVIERLAALDDAIDVHVHIWGESVGLDGPLATVTPGQFVLERIAAFRGWAVANGASLVGFDTRETACEFTGRRYRTLSLPAVAVAASRNGDLVAVAPVLVGAQRVYAEDLLARVVPAETDRLVAP